MIELLLRLQHLDRRWVFLGMAIAIAMPLLLPVSLPFPIDERVQKLYDQVEAVPAGSTVLVSADFDPSSKPELEPFYRANLHHLFRKDVKVVMITLWETGPAFVGPIFSEIAKSYNKEYGKDYAFLGFKSGKETAIKLIGEDIQAAFPKDSQGKDTASLPIMSGIHQAKDFAMLVNVSAGNPGTKEYVLQIQGQYSLKMASATTSVSGTDYIPYYQAGQLFGLSIGMVGSAQYEKLVFGLTPPAGVRMAATQNVNVLSFGVAFIIALIIVGNVAFFATRKMEA